MATPSDRVLLDEVLTDLEVETVKPFHSLSVGQMARRFVWGADRYAAARGCAGWLEKTPEHLSYVAEIRKHVPGAKFIHLIRRGRDVVASLYEVSRQYTYAWARPWPIERCIDTWTTSVARSISWADDPDSLILLYADVTDDPAALTERAWEFLGIADRSFSDADFRGSIASSVPQGHPWQSVSASVERRADGKFRSVFNPDEQAEILNQLQERVRSAELSINGRPVPF